MRRRLIVGLVLVAAVGACRRPIPDLAGIYTSAAQRHEPWRNPVVVIPGILGSRLRDAETGQVVWGAFDGEAADPEEPDGARLVALPMSPGLPLADLVDDVEPDGALDRLTLRLFGVPVSLDAYRNILAILGVGGYRDETLGLAGEIDYGPGHYTCFQFDYDWRHDLVESARRLAAFLEEKRAYVARETQSRTGMRPADIKFDLVAHSMGGLVVRYFLRYGTQDLPPDGSLPVTTWEGARLVERAILVATPNAGSVDALVELIRGDQIAPFLPKYPAAVLGTMPAVYQLLPRGRHDVLADALEPTRIYRDLYDPVLWEHLRWGLADPGQDAVLAELLPDVPEAAERRRIALDHQRKCLARAAAFARALDDPAPLPPGLGLYLFAGDAVPTRAQLAVETDTGAIETVRQAPGDGTVLRTSALFDERAGAAAPARLRSPIGWTQVFFLFTDHLGLTRDAGFVDNVLYLLLEAPRADT